MTEWPKSRLLAAQYQSPFDNGIGFARYASSGTVTPEFWKNIKRIESDAEENPDAPEVEHWAEDMKALRAALREEGVVTDTRWSKANRAASALQTYSMERHDDTYGDEGSEEFWQTIDDFLLDLKHLLFRVDPRVTLEDLSMKAADAWADEVDELPEGGDEDDDD